MVSASVLLFFLSDHVMRSVSWPSLFSLGDGSELIPDEEQAIEHCRQGLFVELERDELGLCRGCGLDCFWLWHLSLRLALDTHLNEHRRHGHARDGV